MLIPCLSPHITKTSSSKQQEGSTCKDSYSKLNVFITTNFDKFNCEGAINRGDTLRACFCHFPLCFLLNFTHRSNLCSTEISLYKTHF